MEKLYDLWFVGCDGEPSSLFDYGVPESEIGERIQQIYESYTAEGYEVIACPSKVM